MDRFKMRNGARRWVNHNNFCAIQSGKLSIERGIFAKTGRNNGAAAKVVVIYKRFSTVF